MADIFVIMGKSSSGKDTIYQKIRERNPQLKTIVGYTTRPPRENEKNGKEYFFVSVDEMKKIEHDGKMIEKRSYHTVQGIWNYFTADDGQVNWKNEKYLLIGTLESYEKIRNYYGKEVVIPIYIEVEDGIRLSRALERERKQTNPRYSELCRRYLADEQDFCEENIRRCGIEKRFENRNLEECLSEIEAYINHFALV